MRAGWPLFGIAIKDEQVLHARHAAPLGFVGLVGIMIAEFSAPRRARDALKVCVKRGDGGPMHNACVECHSERGGWGRVCHDTRCEGQRPLRYSIHLGHRNVKHATLLPVAIALSYNVISNVIDIRVSWYKLLTLYLLSA